MALTITTDTALDAASLAALETIELGATTLAALETITADTELPAARLAADNLALPTAPDVLAVNLLYDGSTLDLERSAPATGGTAAVTGFTGVIPMAYAGSSVYRPWFEAKALGDADALAGGPAAAIWLWNGTTFDRARNNNEGTALTSAARTSTTNSADLVNYNSQIVHVQINVTVWTADNLTPSIQAKDALSGTYYTLLTGSAITGTGFTCLKIGPGITAAANVSAADMLPRTWRVVMTHAGATTTTYSVGYSLGSS